LVFAQLVAKKLDIELHTVDFSKQYKKRVVDYMFSEYQSGRTPNPDILCNREVKFDMFIEKARELQADFTATGHYCRREAITGSRNETSRLLAASDSTKDQSYFLCQLSQAQLRNVLFPIGDMLKKDVRRIAHEQQLPTADKKDSQGICFVGKVDLPTFLQQKLKPKQGDIIEIDKGVAFSTPGMDPSGHYDTNTLELLCREQPFTPDMGRVIGEHNGAHLFTVGQRKGLQIGGKQEPLFVLHADVANNNLYVGQGHDHPLLNRYGLSIKLKDVHWIRPDLQLSDGDCYNYRVRIRYRQPLQKATVYYRGNCYYVLFEKPQRGITPGQFAAWYIEDELVGSGTIS
jgi:tRNA-specific 2-thiouridylase